MQRIQILLAALLATMVAGLPASPAWGQSTTGWVVKQQTLTRVVKRNTPEYLSLMAYLREQADRGAVRYGVTALTPEHLGDSFYINYTGIGAGAAPQNVVPLDVSSPFPPPFIPTGPAGPGSTYVVSSCNTATHEVQVWTWTYVQSSSGAYSWNLTDYHSFYSPSCAIHSNHPAPQ